MKGILKPIIAECFRKWEVQATRQDKQKFCNDANALAEVLIIARSENEKTCKT